MADTQTKSKRLRKWNLARHIGHSRGSKLPTLKESVAERVGKVTPRWTSEERHSRGRLESSGRPMAQAQARRQRKSFLSWAFWYERSLRRKNRLRECGSRCYVNVLYRTGALLVSVFGAPSKSIPILGSAFFLWINCFYFWLWVSCLVLCHGIQDPNYFSRDSDMFLEHST